MRIVVAVIGTVLVLVPSPHAGGAPPAAVAYTTPVPGAIVRPFQPPPGPYAPGHRGVDLAAAQGAAVAAAAAGVVTFAGSVAGRGVLVVRHPDGISTEYEPVAPAVPAGRAVAAGELLGRLSGVHPGCAGSCLHWGARRLGRYLDPMSLLRRLGRVHLVPDRGS